ncbi:MAG: hypothetical protein ACLU30_06470 [Odoribacter splanchnicus]
MKTTAIPGEHRCSPVVFPKYVERPRPFTQGVISYDGKNYTLQMTEDINQIAFKTLHDRMLRELSTRCCGRH